MKVGHNQTYSIPSYPAPEAPRAQTVSPTAASTLVSPHAPTFPRLSRLIASIWNWIRSFFVKIEEPKQGPSPEVLRAIAARQAASAPLLDRETAAIGLVGAALCYWHWEKVSTFAMQIPGHLIAIPTFIASMIPTIIAIQSTSALKTRVETTARAHLPRAIPTWLIRGASVAASSAAVWYASRSIGYGLGQAYLGYLINSTFQGSPSILTSVLSEKTIDYLKQEPALWTSLQVMPSLFVSILMVKAANYTDQETILWAISAFNIARFAQLSFSESPPLPHRKAIS